jgi:hypothetical protein
MAANPRAPIKHLSGISDEFNQPRNPDRTTSL